MKIKFITIIVSSLTTFCFAQKNNCGKIDYTITTNIAYLYQEDFEMVFNDSISYSKEVNVVKRPSKTIREKEEKGVTNRVILGKKATPSFYYNKNHRLYFSEVWDETILIVQEDDFDWNWELHAETKEISGFTCQKATIKFRGRNYTAWFTTDIPVQFGPWKFQGLPGLILEVYDEDRYLFIAVDEVHIDKREYCPIDFDESGLKGALRIDEYLQKRKDMLKEKLAIISSKFPKGTEPLVLDEDCEDCKSESIEIFDEKK